MSDSCHCLNSATSESGRCVRCGHLKPVPHEKPAAYAWRQVNFPLFVRGGEKKTFRWDDGTQTWSELLPVAEAVEESAEGVRNERS